MLQTEVDRFFLKNKYSKWYFNIVNKAIEKKRSKGDEYFELHHILPKAKSLYPEFSSLKDFPWNGVMLSAREHFICHRLLIRCFDGKGRVSMVYGLKRLCHGDKHFTARKYRIARAGFMKVNRGDTHPSFGKTLSAETRAKMSASAPKTKSSEHRRKIGVANTRRVWTAESRLKHSLSSSKKILTDEHKANISAKTSGAKNPMAGTKWIHFPESQESKPVKLDMLQAWIDSGWVIGQSSLTRSLISRR